MPFVSPTLGRAIGKRIRAARLASRVAPRHLGPFLSTTRLATLERGEEIPTLQELVYIATMCGVAVFDVLPEEAIARTLRPLDGPPPLPKAPSIDPTVRVFAVSADTIDDEYHPADGEGELEVEVHEEIKVISEAIEASAGIDVIRTAAEVGRSARVLMGNVRELRAALVALADPRSLWLWHPRNQSAMAGALGEVTRKLHNYVAAAGTLRDHAARFVDRHYPEGSPGRHEWDEQTAAHFGAPERVLVNQLRNYSVHRALPILRAVHGDEARGGGATFIVLDAAELLQSDKWAPPVRTWLEQREVIDLAEVVAGHWVDVQKFYEWFDGWIRATQADALEELGALRRQHEAIIDETRPGLREMFDYMNARKRRENPRRPASVRRVLAARARGTSASRRERR